VKGPTPAIAALVRAGVVHRIHEYVHDPRASSFGAEAAQALGVDPSRVFKTLVTSAERQLAVAVVPVVASLDLKAMAVAVGLKRVEMADPAAAERSTGYVVGAISPLGQKRTLPTVIDESALAWETVYCSGGRRGLEIEITPADLVSLTSGHTAAIARRRHPNGSSR
jgi:Cys-tRNA(Pro)/Cys-tRNA(Cys) deacylase